MTPCSPLIGQEGHIMLADGLELPDNLLEELEYLDNITSCNKVTYWLLSSNIEYYLSTGYDSY